MDIFNILSLLGGLCLFMFGMNLMGEALERRAGNRLRALLSKLTTKKSAGFLTGLGVTAVIQSSSAATVMVVGFVNSGIMTLRQAINVIIGANVGTTITAWFLSLAGIESGNTFVLLLKPSSFTPILAVIGIILYMFIKNKKNKDVGIILLGFATLMYGMESMSESVSGLKDIPEFQNLFLIFKNPILGVLAGAVLTAIIQSSSASVGILQALTITGQVSYGAAIPIIMGQNIGTCVTAILSAIGTNINAKRAAAVHFTFNVIGTSVWLTVFWLIKANFTPLFLEASASYFGIAVAHSIFNILCTLLLLPLSGLFERLVIFLVPDSNNRKSNDIKSLDERLFSAPTVALEHCRSVTLEMAEISVNTMNAAIGLLNDYTPQSAELVKNGEEKTDRYEDVLSSYLVKLSSNSLGDKEIEEAAILLKCIGDFERISDHALNILESVEELKTKDIKFTENAKAELTVLTSAVSEILMLSLDAFKAYDANSVESIEPLEQVIDNLKEKLRTKHILRLQQGKCTIDAGFIWSDLLTDLERTSDHCSNIAGSVMDLSNMDMNIHKNLRAIKRYSETYKRAFAFYSKKYSIN